MGERGRRRKLLTFSSLLPLSNSFTPETNPLSPLIQIEGDREKGEKLAGKFFRRRKNREREKERKESEKRDKMSEYSNRIELEERTSLRKLKLE